MQNSFNWLTSQTVIEINKIAVAETCEPFGIIEISRLEGALNRPYTNWHYNGQENVIALSVDYMFAVAESHTFIQGNKRAGFLSGLEFMRDHGYDLDLPDTTKSAALFKNIIIAKSGYEKYYDYVGQYVVVTDE